MEKKKRGFAAMSKERQKEIAAAGGRAVPEDKRSFSRNRGLAASAGRQGGLNVPDENRSFSRNRDLAAQAGRKGGSSTGKKRAAAKTLAAN